MAKRKLANPKIRRAFNAIMANEMLDKPEPLGVILRRVGYSETTATRPNQVIQSETFQQLMIESGVTKARLSTVLNEGLGATKRYGKDGDVEAPDYAVRHKYLETALKLSGIQESPVVQGNVQNFNTVIQQTNIDPNTPEAKKIIDNTLNILMEQTLAEQK